MFNCCVENPWLSSKVDVWKVEKQNFLCAAYKAAASARQATGTIGAVGLTASGNQLYSLRSTLLWDSQNSRTTSDNYLRMADIC